MARFGIHVASFVDPRGEEALFERIAAAVTAAEDAGFELATVMDHFHQLPPYMERTSPMPEAYVLLGALAARTRRIRLGALVTGVTYRNPAMLAKMATTLDMVSEGRAFLGIGASWNEDEYFAYGFGDDLPPVKERLDRLEDALRIARAMFAEHEASHAGPYHRIDGALNYPRPVQEGGPPILIGGNGERRLLRLVAQYGDMCNLLFVPPEETARKLAVLDAHCAEVGRDPGEIRRTQLVVLVLADTAAEAAEQRAGIQATTEMDDEAFDSLFVAGDAESVRRRTQDYLDAGLDTLIYMAPTMWTPESVAAAGTALRPLMDGG